MNINFFMLHKNIILVYIILMLCFHYILYIQVFLTCFLDLLCFYKEIGSYSLLYVDKQHNIQDLRLTVIFVFIVKYIFIIVKHKHGQYTILIQYYIGQYTTLIQYNIGQTIGNILNLKIKEFIVTYIILSNLYVIFYRCILQ